MLVKALLAHRGRLTSAEQRNALQTCQRLLDLALALGVKGGLGGTGPSAAPVADEDVGDAGVVDAFKAVAGRVPPMIAG